MKLYDKQNFKSGDVLTADNLNHIEEGIENVTNEFDLSRCDFGKEMPIGVSYYNESDVIVCKCKPNSISGSKLQIVTTPDSTAPARGSAYFIDFSSGTIGMHGGVDYKGTIPVIFSQKKVGFNFVAGHEYVIKCIRKKKVHTLIITDNYSLQTDSISVTPTKAGDVGAHFGIRSYKITGDVAILSFKNYSLEPYNCRLLIMGDSFVEGATAFNYTEGYSARYCVYMKRMLNGSCAINGFGGACVEHLLKFYNDYCKTLYKADYVLIAAGTNNFNYSTWLTNQQNLIKAIKDNGSTPILVTITRRLDNDNLNFMRQANEWIRNSGEMYIDVNRITTVNYDGETQNASMFFSDKVHPTAKTHMMVAQKALLDVPEVFNLSANYLSNEENFGAF